MLDWYISKAQIFISQAHAMWKLNRRFINLYFWQGWTLMTPKKKQLSNVNVNVLVVSGFYQVEKIFQYFSVKNISIFSLRVPGPAGGAGWPGQDQSRQSQTALSLVGSRGGSELWLVEIIRLVTPALLCHEDTAQGSLWHKHRWLPCTERISISGPVCSWT